LVTPPGGECVELGFNVRYNDRLGPRKKGGQDERNTFSGARWGVAEDVFWTVVTQIPDLARWVTPGADVNAGVAEKSRRFDVLFIGPSGGPMEIGIYAESVTIKQQHYNK
jgi:hypothetical protein